MLHQLLSSGYSNIQEELTSSFSILDTEVKPLHEEFKQRPRKEIQQNPRKQVHFSDYDDVFEIINLNNMDDDEFYDSYYTWEELKAIRCECISLVQQMNNNKQDLDENLCVRGLHRHTSEHISWRKEIQALLYEAVFEVQAYLDSKGIYSQEFIAELCEKYSSEMVEAAKICGMYDAIHAKD